MYKHWDPYLYFAAVTSDQFFNFPFDYARKISYDYCSWRDRTLVLHIEWPLWSPLHHRHNTVLLLYTWFAIIYVVFKYHSPVSSRNYDWLVNSSIVIADSQTLILPFTVDKWRHSGCHVNGCQWRWRRGGAASGCVGGMWWCCSSAGRSYSTTVPGAGTTDLETNITLHYSHVISKNVACAIDCVSYNRTSKL